MKTKHESIFKSLTDLPSETMAAVKSVSNSAAEMSQQLFGSQMRAALINSDQSRRESRDVQREWHDSDNDSRYWRRGGLNA